MNKYPLLERGINSSQKWIFFCPMCFLLVLSFYIIEFAQNSTLLTYKGGKKKKGITLHIFKKNWGSSKFFLG
jgi:hypothetical protein